MCIDEFFMSRTVPDGKFDVIVGKVNSTRAMLQAAAGVRSNAVCGNVVCCLATHSFLRMACRKARLQCPL